MDITPRNAMIFAILAAIAVVTWVVASDEEHLVIESDATTTVESGYYVLEATIFGSNALGEPRYEIRAAEARQSDRTEAIEMRDIEVRYSGVNEGAWQITADSAALEPTSRELAMTGNVVARRLDNAQFDTLDLRTQALTFIPREERIDSSTSVEFRVGDSRLTAVGMQASLVDDTIRLLSNVRGQYVP